MSQDRAQDIAEPVSDPEFGPWLAQASILVVDDEPGIRNFLVKILAPRCKLIEEAGDAKEASRKVDSQHFDVVILDNIMPEQNGLDWLAQQRAIGFFADVILMTAYADLDAAIEALRAGVVDFILKPFRSNQLLNAVARCLDRMRLQRENDVLRHELTSPPHEILLRNKLLGTSKATVIVVIGLSFAPIIARTVRSAVLAERELDYVAAAQLRHESAFHTMFVEILPNVIPPILVETTVRLGYAIFAVATLSFMGFGIQPPSPDWGLSISNNYGMIGGGFWWTVLFDALAIASLVIGVNLVTDGIQGALND